jgi:hypothetical protein
MRTLREFTRDGLPDSMLTTRETLASICGEHTQIRLACDDTIGEQVA